MAAYERKVGTVSRGIRCPIIREGDDLAAIVTDSVLEAAEAEGFDRHAACRGEEEVRTAPSFSASACRRCDDLRRGQHPRKLQRPTLYDP